MLRLTCITVIASQHCALCVTVQTRSILSELVFCRSYLDMLEASTSGLAESLTGRPTNSTFTGTFDDDMLSVNLLRCIMNQAA